MPTKKATVQALLDRHGRTYSKELGVDLSKNTPSPLFRWLCFSLLASTRISADVAMSGCKAMAAEGWTTPKKMADSTWRDRTDTLNHAGYARYDESTARYLADTCDYLLNDYNGDLRRLRDAAEREPAEARKLLKKCKGIGETGADIFFREVQTVWDEHYPFADKIMLKAAAKLNLADDAQTLARHVPGKADFVRLGAALIRTHLAKDYNAILEAAE